MVTSPSHSLSLSFSLPLSLSLPLTLTLTPSHSLVHRRQQPMRVVTCAAPTNIAVVKYWGKRDVALNTPLNASLSVTLHEDQLRATTSIASDATLQRTRLWLNGQEQPLPDRVATVLEQMQQWAARVHKAPPTADATRALHIASVNSFPTAAGLASSAAGYACLVAALAEFYGLSTADEEFPGQLSAIARQGSGSACRSLHGGFVAWREGRRPDGRGAASQAGGARTRGATLDPGGRPRRHQRDAVGDRRRRGVRPDRRGRPPDEDRR